MPAAWGRGFDPGGKGKKISINLAPGSQSAPGGISRHFYLIFSVLVSLRLGVCIVKLAKEKKGQKIQESAGQKAEAPGNAMETPGQKGRKKQANKESRNHRIKRVERLRGKKVKSWQVLNR
jgi:hypothetical protein